MKKTLVVLTLCFAGVVGASADAISLQGIDFISVSADGNLGPGALYNVATNQGEIDPLLTFDLSGYASDVIDNATLTLTSQALCCQDEQDSFLNTSLSLYALPGPYDPNNATLGSITYPSPSNLVDTESYLVPTSSGGVPLTFIVSSALLEQWANNPSSNYGFMIVESDTSWSTDFGTNEGHSDVAWASGQDAPVLSFDESPAPEPATLLLIGPALAGLFLMRRRSSSVRARLLH